MKRCGGVFFAIKWSIVGNLSNLLAKKDGLPGSPTLLASRTFIRPLGAITCDGPYYTRRQKLTSIKYNEILTILDKEFNLKNTIE